MGERGLSKFFAFDGVSHMSLSAETEEEFRFYAFCILFSSLCTHKATPVRILRGRFYAHGGRTFRTGLLHIDPHDKGPDGNTRYLPVVSIQAAQKFRVCNWCSRYFPDMEHCATCRRAGVSVYYCDSECRDAAWAVHRHTSPHRETCMTCE